MVAEEKITETYANLERRYRPRVFGFFLKNAYSPVDAEDLTQETFLRAYNGLPGFEGEAKLETWLHRIAVNCLINYYRAQKRHNRRYISFASLSSTDGPDSVVNYEDVIPSEERGPEQLVLLSELEEQVRAAVNSLPINWKGVLELQGLEELSYEATAAELNIPLGTMKSRLDRARKSLGLRRGLRKYVLT